MNQEAKVVSGGAPKRILLLGHKKLAWSAFEAVLAAPDVEVVGVVARDVDETAPFWGKARAMRLPCFASVKDLAEVDFDLGISVNFWELIRDPLLHRPRLGFVNVHHSYNLRFRGRHCTTFAIQRARIDNIWHHGTTLHYVSEKLDAGKIIASWACPIMERDTAKDLFERVERLCLGMLDEWLPRVWREAPIAYDPPSVFFVHRDADIADKQVDMTGDPLTIYDKVRSLTFPPYEAPWCQLEGKRGTLHVVGASGRRLVVDAGQGRCVFFEPVEPKDSGDRNGESVTR